MRLSGRALLGPHHQLEQQTAFVKIFKKTFYFVSMGVLSAYVNMHHTYAWCLQFPGTGVSDGCEPFADAGNLTREDKAAWQHLLTLRSCHTKKVMERKLNR